MSELTDKGWQIVKSSDNSKGVKCDHIFVVSVIGDKNSGKSFFLYLLTGKDIPNGYSVTTEGISCIIPMKNDSKNYIIIDTAGTDSPLLTDQENLSKDAKELMAKDRQITDYFLQKFLLEKSDIFLCIVDNLTFSDQKFINRIINKYTDKTIFVIHNLKTFVKISQVENYIQTVLKNSWTFELKENKYLEDNFQVKYNTTDEKETKYTKKQNKKYFKQLLRDNRNVIHFILAKDKSEAGEYYNESTISNIKNLLDSNIDKKEFDVKKELEDYLVSISEEISDSKIAKESITDEGDVIRLKKGILNIKNCFTDIMGNSIIPETKFVPKHRYGYFIEEETKQKKFFLEIELFGDWDLENAVKNKENLFVVEITGTKKNKLIERKYEAKNYNPGDEFSLKIKVENYHGIIDDDSPELEVSNGLYVIIYPLKSNKEKYDDDDDIEEIEDD